MPGSTDQTGNDKEPGKYNPLSKVGPSCILLLPQMAVMGWFLTAVQPYGIAWISYWAAAQGQEKPLTKPPFPTGLVLANIVYTAFTVTVHYTDLKAKFGCDPDAIIQPMGDGAISKEESNDQ